MGNSHQPKYHHAWPHLTVPLRPHPDVVSAVSAAIGVRSGRALLLGVTPELAEIAPDLVAVDRNLSMVENIWPGNTSGRCAIVGDWLNTTFRDDSFSACIGDGALNTVRYADQIFRVCANVHRALKRGGIFVCRLYVADPSDKIATVVKDVQERAIHNFHAFKMRLGMAIGTEATNPNVPVQDIVDVFDDLFSDRDALVRQTGWNRQHIDTIDFYKDSVVEISFPSEAQFLTTISELFPNSHLAPSGSYELAERCPLMVMRKE